MSDIKIQGGKVFFEDCYLKEKLIINTNDYLYNKSNIPFHLFDEYGCINNLKGRVFNGICISTIKQSFDIYQPSKEIVDCNFLIVYLVATYITHITHSVKTAMFNCYDSLIFSLTSIIGMYNSKSQATIIENEIIDNGKNDYLGAISVVQTPPDISLCVSDYNNTNLQSDCFDIVVVQGDILNETTVSKIDETERIFKDTGMIIYILDNKPEIEFLLKERYSDYELYDVSQTLKELKVNKKPEKEIETSLREKYYYLKFIHDIFSVEFIRRIVKNRS